jgi:tetrapyrrole methylase family protein/MazG family protein
MQRNFHYDWRKSMPIGITIIGLGPGGSQHWTQAASELLHQASEIYLRTAQHPGLTDIPAQIHSFDNWYEQSDDFDQVCDQIAIEIVRLGQRDHGVIYGVPGHPNVGEATVPRIRALAQTKHLPVTIIPGLSFLEPTLTALNLNMLDNLQIADATEIASGYHPLLEPDRPALIAHLSSQQIAAQVKRTLLNAYRGDVTVTLVQAAGTLAERVWSCPLSALDNQSRLDTLTTLYLPADVTQSSLSMFQETIAHLRAPEGCPWDREQTHRTLRPFLLEETYEVLEALDAGDPLALAEELGDLLLQIVLHAQIAIDSGEFQMGMIVDHINRKILRRHPHVFEDVVVNGVEDVALNWEAIKKREKAAKNQSDQVASALDGVPAALPALAQALAISKRAVRVGFEWPDIEGVLDKIIEEAREITEASNPLHLESEIGDLLFSVVNLARWRHVDPESALRATNARFSHRFKKMEALAAARGKGLSDMSIEEMDTLWDEAKNDE